MAEYIERDAVLSVIEERQLLYFKMKLLQAEIEMNGMISENKQREINGESMAYTGKDFLNLIAEHEISRADFPFDMEYKY